MSTALLIHAADGIALTDPAPSTAIASENPRLILVGSKADESSRAAVRIAREFETGQTVVRVVAVDDPQTLMRLTQDSRADPGGDLATAVRMQLDGCGCAWPVEIRRGDAAAAICHAAADVNADLIVVGLNEHGLMDRALHRETTLRVLRHTQTPVLAVVSWAIGRPRVIVAAIDFSPASVQAARIAASLAAPGCRIILVHVHSAPADHAGSGQRAFSDIVARGAEDALARLAGGMTLPPNGIAQWMVVNGDPADELLSAAARAGADLITLGARPGGATPIAGKSSVRAALVRDARRSLLVTPWFERRVGSELCAG